MFHISFHGVRRIRKYDDIQYGPKKRFYGFQREFQYILYERISDQVSYFVIFLRFFWFQHSLIILPTYNKKLDISEASLLNNSVVKSINFIENSSKFQAGYHLLYFSYGNRRPRRLYRRSFILSDITVHPKSPWTFDFETHQFSRLVGQFLFQYTVRDGVAVDSTCQTGEISTRFHQSFVDFDSNI